MSKASWASYKSGNALVLLIAIVGVFLACQDASPKRPNILWIYVEDISPDLRCYGNTLVQTPYLDQLAADGILFTNAISPGPVCSPVRSALITGVMQTTLGLHNHHSSRTKASAIYLPDSIKTLPELFKQAGYFTFNKGKDDYNFWYQREDLFSGPYAEHPLYGKSGLPIDWNQRPDRDQPFFGQIQLRGGKHVYSQDFRDKISVPVDRSQVELPPYYPQDSIFKEEWAAYLDTHQITDQEVHEILTQLQEDGLLENTIIFFFADHGMRALRHKQFLYEGGLKVPFILTSYSNQVTLPRGMVNENLISLLDISATSLALAGIPLPAYLDGKDLTAEDHQARDYVISARDRCDFTIDRIRSVRTQRYKYIRNFMTDRVALQANYRDEWESSRYFRELYGQGKLNTVQAKPLNEDRPVEELYDLENDPFEIVNLTDSIPYRQTLEEHRRILQAWIRETNDQGQYPEKDEGLKFMLAIWGEQAVNPEYQKIREVFPELAGSLSQARFAKSIVVENP